MRPMPRALWTLGAALVAGLFLLGAWRWRVEGGEARVEIAELKRQFLERGSVARQLPGDRRQAWVDEVRALTRWYFDELAAIRARHPRERRAAPSSEKDRQRQAEVEE